MSSIKEMFEIAKSYGDPLENIQNHMKNQMQIETGMNKIFQDALTFNQNIAAVNATNAQKAYDAQHDLYKKHGEYQNATKTADYLYDPITGTYRSPETAAQLAAKWGGFNNPYAQIANYNAAQAGAKTSAAAAAPYDPVISTNIQRAFGLLPQSAVENISQTSDGNVVIKNGSGYARPLDSLEAAVFSADPSKTNAQLLSWRRDDTVTQNDHSNQLDRLTHQADLNLHNDMQKMNDDQEFKLNYQSRDFANAAKADARKNAYNQEQLLKEYELKKKLESKTRETGYNRKEFADTFQSLMKTLIDGGSDPQEAARMADAKAREIYGLPPKIPTGSSINSLTEAMKANGTPSAAAEKGKATPAQALPDTDSFMPNTRIGWLETPIPKETKAQQIANLQEIIKMYEPLLATVQPNSIAAQRYAAIINQAKTQLAQAQSMTDEQYFKTENPIESRFNNYMYGDPMYGKR